MSCPQLRPGADDGEDLLRCKIGEGEVMSGREGKNITFAGNRLRAKEKRREAATNIFFRIVVRLSLSDGTVIIDKYERALIIGVHVSLRPLVAWT